jgi:hypothetical protein
MTADVGAVSILQNNLSLATEYVFGEFIPSLFAGNLLSLAIAGLIIIFALILFFSAAVLIFAFVKRFFLVIIVVVSGYFFVTNFQDKLFIPQPDLVLVGIGIIGTAIGLIAVFISLFSFRQQFKDIKIEEQKKSPDIQYLQAPTRSQDEAIKNLRASAGSFEEETGETIIKPPRIYTLQAFNTPIRKQLTTDKSLLAVLSYVIIAEFGIFSSPTLSAPNVIVGFMFLGAFLVGALIFIRTSYHSYKKGIVHLVAASIFGLILSIILGNVWAGIPLDQLISLNYFTTNSLVAFVTGIAVSLLMGTRN